MKRNISILLCLVSTAYTLWYMHFEKPWLNDGALSTIGLEHRLLFTVWGVLTFAALATALLLAYRKYTTVRWHLPLLGLCGLGMVLTLACRFDYDLRAEYVLHCTGSLVFSVGSGVLVFILFFLMKQRLFAVITAVLLLGDMVCLILFKENGLIETVPIFAGYLLLCITNTRRERIEAA